MLRFAILTRAMLLMNLRNRSTLFWNMAFPLMLLVIYSQVFGDMDVGGTGFMDWVVPGVIVFNILAFGLLSSGTMMVNMREKGVLRRLNASPMPTGHLVGSYLVVNVAIALLQSIVILAFAGLVFGTSLSLGRLLLALPLIALGTVAFVALGQVISGVAVTAGVAIALGQIINFSQMFVTDMIMPIEMMPAWIQKAAPFLPAYAAVHLVRPPLLDGHLGPNPVSHALVLAAYAIAAGLAAAALFRWSPRK